jgi:hypothetical protein
LKRLEEKRGELKLGEIIVLSAGLFANEGLSASSEAIQAMRKKVLISAVIGLHFCGTTWFKMRILFYV